MPLRPFSLLSWPAVNWPPVAQPAGVLAPLAAARRVASDAPLGTVTRQNVTPPEPSSTASATGTLVPSATAGTGRLRGRVGLARAGGAAENAAPARARTASRLAARSGPSGTNGLGGSAYSKEPSLAPLLGPWRAIR